MRFRDRIEAGMLLADALAAYRAKPNTIVLALPRGGVIIGAAVAERLQIPLDIVVPRKIGAPENEEYAIGAITEAGDPVWHDAAVAETRASHAHIERAVAKERAEAARRLHVYRRDRPPRALAGNTILLVDDGIATGLTVRAAIRTIRAEGAARIILAVPVAPRDALATLRAEVDDMVCLYAPRLFDAIGAFYDAFDQVTDDAVVAQLRAH